MTNASSSVSPESELQHELTPEERAAEILKRELPRLMNDVAMLVSRPFRFVWDPTSETASTDCIAEIRVSPRPFIEGEREVGYGTVYHETGHICFSPYGMALLERAHREGGQVLQSIMNIILDRKDDSLTVTRAPGFVDTLRRRLLVIRTMTHRMQYRMALSHLSLEQQTRFLRNAKPKSAFEDFFLAAKCGKSPRFPATKRAMKYVRFEQLKTATPEELIWIAMRVWETLRASESDPEQAEANLVKVWAESERADRDKRIDPALLRAINTAVHLYIGSLRMRGIEGLVRQIISLGLTYPGSISVGVSQKSVPVQKVPQSGDHVLAYREIRDRLTPLIDPLVRALKNISTPSEFELYGRDEGDLDFSETARIAARLSGFYQETVVERDIDAEIDLAIDTSGSMSGSKVERAKEIAVVFSEAIKALGQACTGRIWSFNEKAILDYGYISERSGFVTVQGDGNNSDTHMLKTVGTELLKSSKRRKILIVLCDDGPDSNELVKRISQQLMARGLIVVHLLVGVHGTPDIYPVELVYSSIEECLDEFGNLIKTIVSHLK